MIPTKDSRWIQITGTSRKGQTIIVVKADSRSVCYKTPDGKKLRADTDNWHLHFEAVSRG